MCREMEILGARFLTVGEGKYKYGKGEARINNKPCDVGLELKISVSSHSLKYS